MSVGSYRILALAQEYTILQQLSRINMRFINQHHPKKLVIF